MAASASPLVRSSGATPRIPKAWLRGAVGVLAAFTVVELLTRAEFVNEAYVPPASEVVVETVGLFGTGEFWSAMWATLSAAAFGLLRAIVIGVPLGLLFGLSKWAYRASITVVELLRPLPSVALIPLAILVYGRGFDMKAFLVTYACLWPILFNTIYGVHEVDQIGRDTARAFGLGGFRSALRVSLPSASPFIYTGVKVAVSVALILAVGSEIVAGGAEGLGIELGEARANGDLTLSYAYTTVTGLIGIILYIVMEGLERRLFGWNLIGKEPS